MTRPAAVATLDAVLEELERLGVRAEGYLEDDSGNPGVVVIFGEGDVRSFGTSGPWDSIEEAEAWALVVACRARGVVA